MDSERRTIWARILPDGQMTLPPEALDALRLADGGSVVVRIEEESVVLRKPTLDDVAGSVPKLKEPKTWEEIREIADQDRAEEYLRKMREGNA